MYRVFILAFFIFTGMVGAQTVIRPLITPSPVETGGTPDSSTSSSSSDLPDSPDAVPRQEDVVVVGKTSIKASGKKERHCNAWHAVGMIAYDPKKMDALPPLCSELVYPYQKFLDTNVTIPMTRKQKGLLALHASSDPGAIGTIIGISAISIAADSHTAYGPGFGGFAELAGVSLLQNTTGEFFSTFAIPSLVHQDPRYFRMPDKPFRQRLVYSITRSYISRSDSGKTIPNYGVLGAYPIVAELSNLYVPGLETDGASTAERIAIGLALDPVNNLINEFLPDVAKHIHVRIIFVQQFVNNIAVSQGGLP